MSANENAPAANFIRHIVTKDRADGKHDGQVYTRFPPEPNGYLHLGHAKSINLNFGIAQENQGRCNLRFDDTNPEKESEEYVEAIKRDVAWLGCEWDELCHASDYFQRLFDYAVDLIKQGKAYVDSMSADEIREYRGTLTEPGKPSRYRDRSIEENLDLFNRMKAGEFEPGAHVLRAKIDMASPNMNLRDPAIYRIRNVHHQRTGDAWCIYPMYDFTHCLSDAIEGITHSLCTLEFEDHRPLYDWVIDQLDTPSHPQQIEFAPLSLEYTILSKRKLIQLVEGGYVNGWDDPRLPTLSGMRRRGFTPESIRNFCETIGITKNDAWIEMQVLEHSIRNDLNESAERRMAVLDPLKIVLTNFDQETLQLNVANHPQREEMGRRDIPFGREIYIEQEDFEEIAPPGFKRLVAGGEVRLRGSYVIKCDDVIKDEEGNVTALHCSIDFNTLGKKPEGRKVKGVIHWVDASQAVDAEIRLYNTLFSVPNPGAEENFLDAINPDSLQVLPNAKVEPSLKEAPVNSHFQFERQGYYSLDPDSTDTKLVFNRTVTLRDTWGKKG